MKIFIFHAFLIIWSNFVVHMNMQLKQIKWQCLFNIYWKGSTCIALHVLCGCKLKKNRANGCCIWSGFTQTAYFHEMLLPLPWRPTKCFLKAKIILKELKIYPHLQHFGSKSLVNDRIGRSSFWFWHSSTIFSCLICSTFHHHYYPLALAFLDGHKPCEYEKRKHPVNILLLNLSPFNG